jgi:superfamily I DNA/RNA helicase
MLAPLIAALRAEGIPFGNRWRQQRHDWNPLMPPQHGAGMVQRVLDFMRPPDRLWTWVELAGWLPYLVRTAGVLTHGAKALVAAHAEDNGECSLAILRAVFQPHTLDGALRGGIDWLEDHVMQSHAAALAYPSRVYRRHGRNALTDEPRVRLGNAHSFKGTESDTVLQFTELSRSQEVALCGGGDSADDVYRMLYVAATRSRETLILAGPYRDHIGRVAQQRPQPAILETSEIPSRETTDESEAF